MKNAIEAKNLIKKYDEYYDDFELNIKNFEVPQGSIVGLVGKNGAGKTTLIKSIIGIRKPDSGEIKVLGTVPGTDAFADALNDIGIVISDGKFSSSSSARKLENIMSGAYCRWDTNLFQKMLKDADITYDKKYKDLSTGAKVKLQFACAMAHKPKLLILDEPTNGLDPVARSNFNDRLWEFTRDEQNSVLISSHIATDLEKICDYIVFLEKGKILIAEEKDRMIERYGIIKGSKEEIDTLLNKLKEISPDTFPVKKVTEEKYHVSALVDRKQMPTDIEVITIGLEDIFVMMTK